MIKNIVFDLGNVMVTYQPEAYTRAFVRDDAEAKRLCRAIFFSRPWLECDLGGITRQEAIMRVCQENPDDTEIILRITDDCDSKMLAASAENMALVKRLRAAGYNVYYLSNINDPAIEVLTRKYDLFDLFMGGIASNRVHLLKPDPEIYRLLVETYRLKAEECLFIDDMPVNTEAARMLGFHTITLKAIGSLCDELMKFNVRSGKSCLNEV